MPIDHRITNFIKKHHVLTIATAVNNEPWCANIFYAFIEDENAVVFTTAADTRHGSEFRANSVVAGSIVLETKIIGKIRGIQFQGTVSEPDEERLNKARSTYLKKFPVAALMETRFWVVDFTLLKLTDNRLGFGKKLLWSSSPFEGVGGSFAG